MKMAHFCSFAVCGFAFVKNGRHFFFVGEEEEEKVGILAIPIPILLYFSFYSIIFGLYYSLLSLVSLVSSFVAPDLVHFLILFPCWWDHACFSLFPFHFHFIPSLSLVAHPNGVYFHLH